MTQYYIFDKSLHMFNALRVLLGAFCKPLICAVVTVIVIAGGATAVAADLSFEAVGAGRPIVITPPTNTGLETVFVLPEIGNSSSVKFRADGSGSASTVKWLCFSNLGGGFAEAVPSHSEGDVSVMNLGAIADISGREGIGCIVEYDGRQHCYWFVNYARNECRVESLNFVPEQECDRTALTFEGNAGKISYYSVNGVQQTLSRDMELSYTTLVYDEDRRQYVPSDVSLSLDYADATIRVEAPLCDTHFVITTDRFKREWGETASVSSPLFSTGAIAAVTYTTQTSRSNDNEQREEKAALGGSGPVEITFTAEVTDAVIYKEWQFARDKGFDVIDLRIQELEVTHVFREQGTTYVRFVAGNNSGSCDYVGETYEVYIGESTLECPNAFSPGATEGTNDEWKVSYKSIIEFDCHIFNRWGLEMAHLTDPSQGWDGRYKGKLVPSGVYYYVIKAKGTDGRDYKLSGDINILKYSNDSSTTRPQ